MEIDREKHLRLKKCVAEKWKKTGAEKQKVLMKTVWDSQKDLRFLKEL